MPTTMRAAWVFKEVAPKRLVRATRAVTHRWP